MYLDGISRPLRGISVYEIHVNVKRYNSTYHGRLSSASTGKFAALRLPFEVVASEPNIIESFALGATSISISSS